MRSVIGNITTSCGLCPNNVKDPTIIYEDNAACIEQMKTGYIKGDKTKHIDPKFFFNQQQQHKNRISVEAIRSDCNPADLFTQSLPRAMLEKHAKAIGLCRLSDLIRPDESKGVRLQGE